MAERFAEVYRLPEQLYSEGAPVLLEAGVLLKDTKTNKVLAQLKFRNISERSINGIKIRLRLFDIGDAVLENAFSYSYLDLHAETGSEFGQKTPVFLPKPDARKMEFIGVSVFYSDGDSIEKDEGWLPLEKQENIADRLEEKELIKQWEIENSTGPAMLQQAAKYVPIKQNGLFRCTCGAVNLDSAVQCYACGRSIDAMLNLLSGTQLSEHTSERLRIEAEKEAARIEKLRQEEEKRIAEQKAKEERLAAEREAQRIAQEETAKRRKKRRKITAIVLSIIAIIIVAIVLLVKLIIPGIKYNKAKGWLEAKDYENAYTAFCELGEFSDSEAYALETLYRKANDLIIEKDFDDANEILNSILGYKDSADLIHTHRFEGKVTTDPTCTELGVKTYTCQIDGCRNYYTEYVKATGHRFESSVSVEAGCTTEGERLLTCITCGHEEKESIKATGHVYVDTITTAPRCETKGVKTYTCSKCGDTYNKEIAATGHSWTSATCTTAKRCTVCGKTEGGALGHTSAGKCSRCGADFRQTYVLTGDDSTSLDMSVVPDYFFTGRYYIRFEVSKSDELSTWSGASVYDPSGGFMGNLWNGEPLYLNSQFGRIGIRYEKIFLHGTWNLTIGPA